MKIFARNLVPKIVTGSEETVSVRLEQQLLSQNNQVTNTEMKPNKKMLLTLCAAAAVAITPFAVADSPGDCGLMGHHGHPDLTRMLTHTLNLSDAQQTQVKTLVAEVQPQLDAIHQQARQSADAVMKQLNTKIRPLLTADQQKRLDALETLHSTQPGTE